MGGDNQQAIRHWTVAQPIVSAYVASIVRDFRDRDDVLQEVAVAVLESFSGYDPSRPFVGWAIGIARNQIGTYLRNRKRNRLVFDGETVELLAIAEDLDSGVGNRRPGNFLVHPVSHETGYIIQGYDNEACENNLLRGCPTNACHLNHFSRARWS